MVKVKHWRASQAILLPEAAPVLDFGTIVIVSIR